MAKSMSRIVAERVSVYGYIGKECWYKTPENIASTGMKNISPVNRHIKPMHSSRLIACDHRKTS
jgi:hypothetical protein